MKDRAVFDESIRRHSEVLVLDDDDLQQEASHQVNTKRYWNSEEDLKLTELVRQFGAKNWKKIASYLD